MPVYNPPEQYLREAIDSVLQQHYPNWELCIADDASPNPQVRAILKDYAAQDDRIKLVLRETNGHIAQASNSALSLATGEFIALLDHDDLLTPDALSAVSAVLSAQPDTDMLYTDEAIINDAHVVQHQMLKPDWCPDTFLSLMYTCHLGVYRRSLITTIGGFREGFEGSQDYDLVLRVTEQTDRIVHVPKVLYFWRQHPESVTSGTGVKRYAYNAAERAIAGALQRRQELGRVVPHPKLLGLYTIRYALPSYDRVSIIIAVCGQGNGLQRCLTSLISQTVYPDYEVVVIHNGSLAPVNHRLVIDWQTREPDWFRVIAVEPSQTMPQLQNHAAAHATGSYLLFLDENVAITTPDWLEAMVEQGQRPAIGAVGATLSYLNGQLYHAGIVLYGAPSYVTTPYAYTRNCAAVTTNGLLCRHAVFQAIGGFKEEFYTFGYEVDLWGVDFCLRLLTQGYRHVCLPHASLCYYGEKQLSWEGSPEVLMGLSAKIECFAQRWLSYLQHDPCHSPHHYWRVHQPSFDYSVSVVVPWWDHTEFLELWERNMEHLRQTQVIFIDNGSQPEGERALREFCHRHRVTLIRNATNLGFAAANNQGAAIATGTFILHLNNDLEIVQLPLTYLCAVAREGISGYGFCYNELGIQYIEGWALCINRYTLQQLGGWTEDYGPGYWDDADLCYRATQAGYSMVPVPALKQMIRHITNATGRDGRLDQIALHLRNRGRFIQKYFHTTPKILIDGVFFQRYKTGIARVWRTLLEEWSTTEFAQYLVLLDRAGTAPTIPNIRTRRIPPHDYNRLEDDRALLQELCDEEGADLFVSTYYSRPLSTPSVLMVHDMIPEVAASHDPRATLEEPMWQEKHEAIQQASAYIAVSKNTAHDLLTFFPDIQPSQVTIAKEGVSTTFQPASPQVIAAFKQKYGIHKPYFLTVGSSLGYKNTILFYQGIGQLVSRQGFEIVAVGSGVLEDEFRAYTDGITVHTLRLSDEELAIAYSGAIALVYPSKYEGFGLPIVEAMACGCPVITCANGSIPEVAGDAVLYVSDTDVNEMVDALCEVQKPQVRRSLTAAGLERARSYSWADMATAVAAALVDATLLPLGLQAQNYIVFPDWSQGDDAIGEHLAMLVQRCVASCGEIPTTLLIDTHNIAPELADQVVSGVIMALALETGLDVTETLCISLVPHLGEIQWQALAPKLTARLVFSAENGAAIQATQLQQLQALEL